MVSKPRKFKWRSELDNRRSQRIEWPYLKHLSHGHGGSWVKLVSRPPSLEGTMLETWIYVYLIHRWFSWVMLLCFQVNFWSPDCAWAKTCTNAGKRHSGKWRKSEKVRLPLGHLESKLIEDTCLDAKPEALLKVLQTCGVEVFQDVSRGLRLAIRPLEEA